jgi:hypothetical protein
MDGRQCHSNGNSHTSMSDIHIHIDRETPVKVITLEPSGKRGPAGPNSVTSATTSDGTANLDILLLTINDDGGAINITGSDASIGVAGLNGTISVTGEFGSIFADGANASIRTANGGYFETTSTYKINSGGAITTLSHAATASSAISFPDASGTVALFDENGNLTVTGTLTADHIHGNLAGSVYAHVRAGEALAKGDPVYISGSHGSGSTLIPIVSKADASNAAKMPAVGIMDAPLANNASGHMVITGTITELNTNAYAVNSVLYVATGGGFTATPPAANSQPVAIVERSNTNNGAVIVKVNGLASSGGNGASDANKLVRFGSAGTIPVASIGGLGANVATYLAAPTVANWRAATSGTSDLITVGPNEVSITGATTLTSTAFGLIHVCSGTSADYQVDLPSVSGNAGRIITIRMSSALTRFVTIAGAGGALIDGLATRIMWAQESAILMCDGANWTKIAGKSRPLTYAGENGAGVTVANNTLVPISMATVITDNSTRMSDTVSSVNVCRIRRPGSYDISGMISLSRAGSFAGFEAYCTFLVNSTTTNASSPSMLTVVPTSINSVPDTFSHAALACTRTLAGNDYIALAVFQSTGGSMTTRTIAIVRPNLVVTEIPTW